MKNSIFAIILSVFIVSCVPEDHVLELEIINSTGEPVKDVKVLTAGDKITFEVDVLPAGQKIDHTLNIGNDVADGKYTFRFSRNNGAQESTSGSYLEEGGKYLKKTLVFQIQEENVKVDQKVLEVE